MTATYKKRPGPEYAIPPEARIQDQVNQAVYWSENVYLYYQFTSIMPVEAACFAKYADHINGHDILDVGVGTGRTSRYLAPIARQYEAIDYSPVMVNYVRKHQPGISVRQSDFRDLRAFDDESFDFILATANIIDALPHEGRISALNETRRVLRPGGIFAFSCHNLNYSRAFSGPRMKWSLNPVKLARSLVMFTLGSWNHRRVGPMRRQTPEYALLNDTGHFYSCLHYYASRPTVTEQLHKAGMKLLEVLNEKGDALPASASDTDQPWLFFIAQRDANPA